jgi:hypothetical protein
MENLGIDHEWVMHFWSHADFIITQRLRKISHRLRGLNGAAVSPSGSSVNERNDWLAQRV